MHHWTYYNLASLIFGTTIPTSFNILMKCFKLLSFTITPISTFSRAFVSEIQYNACLKLFVVILQDLHCLQRFYHNVDHWGIKLYKTHIYSHGALQNSHLLTWSFHQSDIGLCGFHQSDIGLCGFHQSDRGLCGSYHNSLKC